MMTYHPNLLLKDLRREKIWHRGVRPVTTQNGLYGNKRWLAKARGLKFWIKEEEIVLCSENHTAHLCLCFHICRFSHDAAQMSHVLRNHASNIVAYKTA